MSEEPRSVEWAVRGLAQLFDTVLTVAGTSGDLAESDREQFVETGVAAFNAGLSLSGLIDSYLGGAGEVWEHVFADADPLHTVELGRSLRRVSERAVSSLAEGFEAAQRISIRAEESLRRTFLDDLLDHHPDPVRLGDLAKQLDFPPFAEVIVAVASGEREVNDGGAIHRRVMTDLQSRAPTRHLVITAKDGRIVVIAVDTTVSELGSLLSGAVHAVSDVAWQIGIGQPVVALEGVGTSYRQAIEAMRLGRIFALDGPSDFGRMFAERLFGADPEVSRTMVSTVLGPLIERPKSELLETLMSFIDHGGNMAVVARDLNIGSRTVAYRLGRIHDLTGYSAREADERFILELACRALPLSTAWLPRDPRRG